MDGFEVARELKLDPRTREVPIVVLTASQPGRGERERLKGKIEALVSKGATVGGPDLIPVINQVLIRCGARDPS
jgi:CheY-like chemotaxis protein